MDFFEGGEEGFEKNGWEVANESDGIGEEGGFFEVGEPELADAVFEGGEKFVSYVKVFLLSQRLEEGGFAAVGVTDESDEREILAAAVSALVGVDFSEGLEFFFDFGDALAEVLALNFEEFFAAAAADSEMAGLLGEGCAFAEEFGEFVF